jgi:hypothetical protein
VVRLDLRAVPALVEHEPHLCQRNAWGQEVQSAGACASDAVLRELLRATLEDLARYEPTGLELADWLPDAAADRTAARPLDWHPAVRRLLDICFCPSCRQIAERSGVDPDQAARSVRVLVERWLAAGKDQPEDDVIRGYVAPRASDASSWLNGLASGDPQRQYFLVYPPEELHAHLRGTSMRGLVRLADGAANLGNLEQTLDLVWKAHVSGGGLSLPVWQPTFAEAPALVRLVSDAVEHGVQTFDFEGLDEALPEAVTWLKQAVRYARRG